MLQIGSARTLAPSDSWSGRQLCPGWQSKRRQILAPRLILLATRLPTLDGMTVCKALKRHPLTERVPIIVVGPANDQDCAAAALEQGADDYLTKPLQPTIALAKLRALLRRTEESVDRAPRVIRIHDLFIDGDRGRVVLGDRTTIDLTPIPFRLLFALASQPGRLFTQEELAGTLAYSPLQNNEHKLRFHISALRAGLGPAGRYIETVTQCGYRMRTEMGPTTRAAKRSTGAALSS